ncbi:energy-coupling factor transporter transmembrane component T family protein [Marinicrinis lubricantis]|uniref:Energy-coupling factor transporter transmembrane component T family protein n=1 Tax=Marinicrinis lubricantis TaxID=2086470 RepID=A0ABW1IP89_9BACL
MEAVRRILDKISIEEIKLQLLRTAYGNGGTFLAKLDPRTLIAWYMFFGIVPWFIYDPVILLGLFLFLMTTTLCSKVSPIIMIILCLGLMSQAGSLFIVSLFFSGGWDAIVPLLLLTLRLSVISLASITVFSSMDPEKFSDGLLSFGVPHHVSFSIAYGYRMLPTLIEEYQNILLSFRLRGKGPEKNGILYWRVLAYYLKLSVISFYPLILNTAKRARTTVEALETRGFTYAFKHPEVKRLKLSHLAFTMKDGQFLAGSAGYVILIFWIGRSF